VLAHLGDIELKQLIYRSQPFGFDSSMLAGLLTQARRNNLRDNITGALFCRHDVYLQLIEGPSAKIDALYSQICKDDRHCDVKLLHSEMVDERIFPEWEMLHDEMPTLTWSPRAVADGALEKARPDELRAAFKRIGDKARNGAALA
jgi:hypothetical protein